jgi:hypothetical protein
METSLTSLTQTITIASWIIAIIGGLLCAVFAASLAKQKGYNQNDGCVFGFLFGIPALLYYIGLPDQKARVKRIDIRDSIDELRAELQELRSEIRRFSSVVEGEFLTKRQKEEKDR